MTNKTFNTRLDEIVEAFEAGRRFDGDTDRDYISEAKQALRDLFLEVLPEKKNPDPSVMDFGGDSYGAALNNKAAAQFENLTHNKVIDSITLTIEGKHGG